MVKVNGLFVAELIDGISTEVGSTERDSAEKVFCWKDLQIDD